MSLHEKNGLHLDTSLLTPFSGVISALETLPEKILLAAILLYRITIIKNNDNA
jgi:hypothetical protein